MPDSLVEYTFDTSEAQPDLFLSEKRRIVDKASESLSRACGKGSEQRLFIKI